MTGKSPLTASEAQRAGLMVLAGSRDRGEADRARAVLLTLSGWTSGRLAEAFGVREDTVRLWRSDFMSGGVDALKASVAPRSNDFIAHLQALERLYGPKPGMPIKPVVIVLDNGRSTSARRR